jgi:hypothetical protein
MTENVGNQTPSSPYPCVINGRKVLIVYRYIEGSIHIKLPLKPSTV